MGFAKRMGLPDSEDTGKYNIMRDGSDEVMLGCWVEEDIAKQHLERYKKRYPKYASGFFIIKRED